LKPWNIWAKIRYVKPRLFRSVIFTPWRIANKVATVTLKGKLMNLPRISVSFLGLFVSLVCTFPALGIASDDWKPIDPTNLTMKVPVVEKDADAEALFWEVRIDDDPEGDLIFNHYIRIKVFSERGRESQSKVDIPFGNLFGREIKIQDIAARTIEPDGSIVELKKEDVFERTIVKVSGLKMKAKSFAMPAVEAGSLIEYRWKEVRVGRSANYIRLQFQRDIPVEEVKYVIKPLAGLTFRSVTFHGSPSPFVKEKNGFFSTTMTKMPAVREESRMPPDDQVKTWMLVYYTRTDNNINPEKFWPDYGKSVYDSTKSLLKVNDEVRQVAASLTSDAKNDEEKLRRLFEFCRNDIKNISDDAAGLSPEERKKVKQNKTPSDTLKQKMGTGADVDLLFAALATASGFDARIVLAPDRSDIFFDKSFADDYFVEPSNIGVNIGGSWKFFNPGYNYIPFGMLRWQEEGEEVLITDPKQPVWATTPFSPPEKSVTKRSAKLKLDAEGTLEGDVVVEYSGHFGIERKEANDSHSETEREDSLKEEVKAQLSTAELSNIKILNVTDPVKPFTYSYHLRVPGYAQRTGKRLFLQPALFQHGVGPLFSTSERKYPVYFHYPWSEEDTVDIELPEGYGLDNPEQPAPFASGAISAYKPFIGVSADGKLLHFTRNFFFGGNGALLYPVETYPHLKAFFDLLQKSDNHTIALKQAAGAQ
jgi:Domain of Unknown Function with PDB structure (DUF3857)/Transglutaminase-like superfamily